MRVADPYRIAATRNELGLEQATLQIEQPYRKPESGRIAVANRRDGSIARKRHDSCLYAPQRSPQRNGDPTYLIIVRESERIAGERRPQRIDLADAVAAARIEIDLLQQRYVGIHPGDRLDDFLQVPGRSLAAVAHAPAAVVEKVHVVA